MLLTSLTKHQQTVLYYPVHKLWESVLILPLLFLESPPTYLCVLLKQFGEILEKWMLRSQEIKLVVALLPVH
jgi:hypothetical protein